MIVTVVVPMQYGFEYEVKLSVSIPIVWARLLKETAKHHYDYRCRECGDRGVINALYNTSFDGECPSNHPVTFSDLNLVSSRHHTDDSDLVFAIHAWLQDTRGALDRQRALCMKLPGSAVEYGA